MEVLRADQVASLRATFDRFASSSSSGESTLGADDMAVLLAACGVPITPMDAASLVALTDPRGRLGFDGFVSVMCSSALPDVAEEAELSRVFDAMDADHDGFIDAGDVSRFVAAAGAREYERSVLDAADVATIVAVLSPTGTGSGRLGFEEFAHGMRMQLQRRVARAAVPPKATESPPAAAAAVPAAAQAPASSAPAAGDAKPAAASAKGPKK